MPAKVPEQNYYFQWLSLQPLFGDIAEAMMVNAHRFSAVAPAVMDRKVDETILRLMEFRKLYREQYSTTDQKMKR